MEEKSLPKINAILVSFIILLGGISLAILTLLLTLAPPRPGDYVSKSIFAWISIPIFLIFFLEGIFWRLKKDIAIREENIEYKDKGLWSTIALTFQYLGIIRGILSIFTLIALFGLFFYITPIRDIFTKGAVFSGRFFLLISVYFIYLIMRPIFKRSSLKSSFSRAGKSIASNVAKNLPKYRIFEDGIEINLNWKGLGKMKDKEWIIKVNFDEVDEIREMTYWESDAFMKHTIGPNVELQIKDTKGIYNYMKGKIDKPPVYIATGLNQNNKVVFMKGKDLFYLISFDSPDVSDILLAYKNYKQKRQR